MATNEAGVKTWCEEELVMFCLRFSEFVIESKETI